jgi:glutamine amidotransferase
MQVAVIKYNAGNVRSVLFALERLGVHPLVTDDHNTIISSDKVIFPGVGEASSTMRYLSSRGLDQLLPNLQQPVLGICLGLQLLCSHSDEGNTACIGVYQNAVRRFHSEGLKVPHIGWNLVKHTESPLFEGLGTTHFYFVHSYYASVNHQTVATSDYGTPFSAALQERNFYATQFHPEKSGASGERILRNFLNF